MKRIVIFVIFVAIVSCSNNTNNEYYANGTLKHKITIKDGRKNGPAKFYYETGELECEYLYKNDLREGMGIVYHENGNKKSEVNYKNDKSNGIYIEYDENSMLKTKANFKDGKQDGQTKQYFKNGVLKSEENYKNGVENGRMIFYYENGKVKLNSLMENSETVYYEEYDSLGNKIKEYRVLQTEIESREIKLGDTFKTKLKISGPIINSEIQASIGQADNINNIKTMKIFQANDNGEVIYSYKPDKKGIYAWRAFYFVKDKISLKNEVYTYEDTFRCN